MPERPDRILFPDTGFTAGDAVAYYRRIARRMLLHLKNVPVSFKRFPDTVEGESFWEKDAPSFTPKWVRTFGVPRRGGGPDIQYVMIDDVRTLTWIAEAGGIEIHPFLHRAPRVERATAVVFDLDPGEGASIAEACDVALLLRDALATLALESFAKVSGSKGVQVYVPLNGDATHGTTEAFARVVAEELARRHPARITAKMGKTYRARKVFIDYSQNADYKTTVAAYSLRAKGERPLVSMPVTWAEVARGGALEFGPEEALARKGDLWAAVRVMKQELPVWVPASAGTRPAKAGRYTTDLPKPRSQSGRRLFVVVGDELWLDMGGRFKRWIVDGERAVPARDLPRSDPPEDARDAGSYEIIEGSFERGRFDLWFNGRTMTGQWLLEKAGDSWRLAPA